MDNNHATIVKGVVKAKVKASVPKVIHGGGTSSWNDITDKPFETIGNGLNVQNGELTISRPYLSLERLGAYLYQATFDTLQSNASLDTGMSGGCTSYVQDGKLYRNLDWDYSDLASFRVVCPKFDGIAFLPGLTDEEIDDALIGQLPYHIVDGVNNRGIMAATHVLFNDCGWHGIEGGIPLTEMVYQIMTHVRSMSTIEEDLADILPQLCTTPIMDASEYLAQYIVTDGIATYIITPPETADGVYTLVDASNNPKLTNFKWVEQETVTRDELQERPTGVERWNMIPAELNDLKFTAAYESPTRLSEFIGLRGTTKDSTDAELLSVYNDAHAAYEERTRDGSTWQTMHSVVYSPAGMEHLWVQENWAKDYVAQSGGGSGPSSWEQLSGKPFSSIGDGLKVTDNVLSVDVATAVEEDNTKPITSAAVFTEVGNINALLVLI